FFFSSRRRHTRSDRDWSSDVCSSDLETCVVRFTTDIPHLTNWGTPLLLGPGSILDAHTAHERISVAELAQGVDAYVRLVHALSRSEERRVGKECRSRGWRCQLNRMKV